MRVGGNTKGVPVPSLARLRKQAGMSQSTLAERAGVGRNTISRLEHGANAHYGTIDKLVEALGITRSRLIKPSRQGEQRTRNRDNS
jgi:transcriptional regulator with XRE-family HTH domain